MSFHLRTSPGLDIGSDAELLSRSSVSLRLSEAEPTNSDAPTISSEPTKVHDPDRVPTSPFPKEPSSSSTKKGEDISANKGPKTSANCPFLPSSTAIRFSAASNSSVLSASAFSRSSIRAKATPR